MDITAIILAGGLASRMGEICSDIPKCMLKFSGYHFLQYLVSWLIRLGIREVIISTCHLSAKVESVFGVEFWEMRGIKVLREYRPLGTGGAVRFAADYSSNEEVFLCNGDTIVELELIKLYEWHKLLGTNITAILTFSDNVPNQGAVLVENGIITEFREGEEIKKPVIGKNFFRASSTGCYFLKRSAVLDFFPSGYSSLEREIIPMLVEKRVVGGISTRTGLFMDYGTPEMYKSLKTNVRILERIYGTPLMEGE